VELTGFEPVLLDCTPRYRTPDHHCRDTRRARWDTGHLAGARPARQSPRKSAT